MRTKLSIRFHLKISPRLVLTSKVLQLPRSELEQFVYSALVDNPALEFASEPDPMKARRRLDNFSGQSTSYTKAPSKDLQSFDQVVENIAQPRSPLESLAEQIALTRDKTDRDVAMYLLHCLDDRGYLVVPLEELAYELKVTTERIERGIRILHQLEPPGIGARDLRECFLIQCIHLEREGVDCQQAHRILTLAWNEFLKQQWDRVAKKIREPSRYVKQTCQFMRENLYPYPLAMLGSIETSDVLHAPDIIIWQNRQTNSPRYSLELPGAEEFDLKISSVFQTQLDSAAENDDQLSVPERTWIRSHVDQALIVIAALHQRWETLRQIGEYLIRYQHDFLEHGFGSLKPLTRVAVADALNIHESTISRAVSDKVVQLPSGHLILLSDFFDPSLATKEAIRQILRDNPKPLCDREIAEGLQKMGVTISRRTVTKYRREIHIDSNRRQPFAF